MSRIEFAGRHDRRKRRPKAAFVVGASSWACGGALTGALHSEAGEVWWLLRQGADRLRFDFWAGDIVMNVDDCERSNARRQKDPSIPPVGSIALGIVPPIAGLVVDNLVRDLREQYEAAARAPLSVLFHADAMATRIKVEYEGAPGVVSRNSNDAIGECASRLLDDARLLISRYTAPQCPRFSLFSCCS